MKSVSKILALCFALFILSSGNPAFSQDAGLGEGGVLIPSINIGVDTAQSPTDVALSLQIILLITVISLAPAILILLTSFVRIYIVFSFVSRGLATQTLPPNQIIVGLSLFLTLFIMYPVFSSSYTEGIKPYIDGELTLEEGFTAAVAPVREFLFLQTDERYIYRFVQLAGVDRPATQEDVPTYVLIPAYVLNELTLSFYMGMLILIPFTIIDVVVASTLMSMGMMMLPPIMISFPIKIVLFVLVDGWNLLTENLVSSFGLLQ